MRIAVVGSGISGLVAAYRLQPAHQVTVFEAGAYVGGHTHTVDVESGGRHYAVDTGFIVFNDWTYPNFVRLLDELRVPWQNSAMSFSVHCERTRLEYNGTSLNTLFAQRRNLVRPAFLRMVRDILRFNAQAPRLLEESGEELPLGEYLHRERYSRSFLEYYLIPMAAAVWSSRPDDMLKFPTRFLVRFFANHGFLSVSNRPVWRVVRGGSREYVKRLTAPFADRIRLNTPVKSIRRQPGSVVLRLGDGSLETFDRVVLACHSDQALALLSDPSAAERDILGAIPYQENEVLLHTDARQMPRRRLAWAAWNYHLPLGSERVTVTYNMNILQSLAAPDPLLVSLNRGAHIDRGHVLGRYVYHHPVFTPAAVAAQQRRREIDGVNLTHYCGAYWGYGFHEDGVNSALSTLQRFNEHSDAQPNLQRVG